MEANYPYAIMNQRGASKISLVGGILSSKAPSRGLWMPELVLYGIRLLVKQFLGTVLDIELDQPGADTDMQAGSLWHKNSWLPCTESKICYYYI